MADSGPEGPLTRFLRSYRMREVVFEEGSSGAEMYLIHSGKVKLSVKNGSQDETVLTVLKAGDFFGEMALVDDRRRSATACAVEDDTRLVVLDKRKFVYMVQQQPQFALSVMHTLCQRLRDLDSRFSARAVQA